MNESLDEKLQIVTNLVISKLEQMDTKQQQSWVNMVSPPSNLSGHRYSGSNELFLTMFTNERKFAAPVYLTSAQAKSKELQILSGEKAFPVFYYDPIISDANGNKIKHEDYKLLSDEDKAKYVVKPFLKSYDVFNVDQTNMREVQPDKYADLVGQYQLPPKDYQHEQLSSMLDNKTWGCPIEIGENKAHYNLTNDKITIPSKDQFTSHEKFFDTLLHEMAHSTGHPKRLNRPLKDVSNTNSTGYAREELVAELSAAISGMKLGVQKEIRTENLAYVKNWITAAKEDKRFVYKAVVDATKASDYICEQLGIKNELEQSVVQAKEKFVRKDSMDGTITMEDKNVAKKNFYSPETNYNAPQVQQKAAARVTQAQQTLQDTKTFANAVSLLNSSHHLDDNTILYVDDKGSPQYRDDIYATLTEQVSKHAGNPKITENQVQALAQHRELFSKNEQSHAVYRLLLKTDYAKQHEITSTLDHESVRNPTPLHLIGLDVAIAECGKQGTLSKKETKKLAYLEKLRSGIDRKLNPQPGLFAILREVREALRPRNIWRGMKEAAKTLIEVARASRAESRLNKLNKLTGNSQAKARQSSKDFYAYLEAQRQVDMEKYQSSYLESQIAVQKNAHTQLEAQKNSQLEKEFDDFLKKPKEHRIEQAGQAQQSTPVPQRSPQQETHVQLGNIKTSPLEMEKHQSSLLEKQRGYGSEDVRSTLGELLQNPTSEDIRNSTIELNAALSKNKDEFRTRCKKAQSQVTPVKELAELGKDENPFVRTTVAENPKTSAIVLSKLSNDKIDDVRQAVAGNPKTSGKVLDRLSFDKNYLVRLAIVLNPKTPDKILTKLKEDNNPYVKAAVHDVMESRTKAKPREQQQSLDFNSFLENEKKSHIEQTQQTAPASQPAPQQVAAQPVLPTEQAREIQQAKPISPQPAAALGKVVEKMQAAGYSR
jgi:antirestriction protein ArdC